MGTPKPKVPNPGQYNFTVIKLVSRLPTITGHPGSLYEAKASQNR